ncbi:ArnT family glycosyltransferase [Runella slithyformis]|uniref:Glycosyl transferase family 39 n=1 Tax=Runella slithyformis (strain ATCC 29530 / DSM 19594 / LMG 11500 / NCIMB 11436 / LSU 4) TaxID=761193 RepID=A0A7U3ZPI0_RUNSL|nr:glycosyl transferase family protein [Runella slithyformis]AEI50997.1 glycosyl transferase family 39 [Runella slithyformis DSM 19594]
MKKTIPNPYHLLAVLLAVPALFSHLGYIPLDMSTDEARRALVALEMDLTGNYLTPTLNGNFYFNKPPLYNWLILGSYRLWGDYSAWSLRFPMAVSVVGYSLTIFWCLRRYVSYQTAAVVALLQLVNGRVLFYETLFGLIDSTYSWVTFSGFMAVYAFDRKKNYWALFLLSYLLTTLGFMMKGLPSLVFQGVTLGVWLGYQRKWRVLWHPAHFAGIALFVGLVGTYYTLSAAQFGFPLGKAVEILWSESAKRTGLAFGWQATMEHLATFPFEFIFHFLPFTLLAVFLIRPRPSDLWRGDPFLTFCGLIFVANVAVYWVSPQVYARYTLMLLPLFFTPLVQAYYSPAEGSRPRRWVEWVYGGAMGLTSAAIWVALWIKSTRDLPEVYGVCALTMTVLAGCTWVFWKTPARRLDIFIIFLLIARISFNFLFVPPRKEKRQRYREDNERAARLTLDAQGRPLPLYSYRQTLGDDGSTDVNSFHLSALRRRVLTMTSEKIPGAYYIADSANLAGEKYTEYGRILLYPERPAKIVRFE